MTDHLWAGWRSEYVSGQTTPTEGCVFCLIRDGRLSDEEANLVWKGDQAFAVLNRYPYGTGHTLVIPNRHVEDIGELTGEESHGLWDATTDTVAAVRAAYSCEGVNVGLNLGAAAGAGIPGHLHVHVLPRWKADTNFMPTVANTRVLPEALSITWGKIRASWPD